MQLELFLKYYKAAFKDFKVLTRLGRLGGRVACLKLELKLAKP